MQDLIFEIPSTTTRYECYILWDLANKLPDESIIVEIGTGAGRVTAIFADAVGGKGTIIHSIDNYSQEEKYGIYGEWKKECEKYLKGLNLIGHVKLIRGDSKEIAKTFPEKIDLLYIDGDHGYQPVYDDITSWYPLIKSGGIIAGHDFDPNCDDGRNVIRAIFNTILVEDRPFTVRERVWWTEK